MITAEILNVGPFDHIDRRAKAVSPKRKAGAQLDALHRLPLDQLRYDLRPKQLELMHCFFVRKAGPLWFEHEMRHAELFAQLIKSISAFIRGSEDEARVDIFVCLGSKVLILSLQPLTETPF